MVFQAIGSLARHRIDATSDPSRLLPTSSSGVYFGRGIAPRRYLQSHRFRTESSAVHINHRECIIRSHASASVACEAGHDPDSRETDKQMIVVLTTLGCPFCRKTKAALRDAGIPFREVDLSTRLSTLSRVKEQTGRDTVPQVFVGGQLVGGCSETLELLDTGKLKQILQKANEPGLPKELDEFIQQTSSTEQRDLETLVRPEEMSQEQYRELRRFASELPKLLSRDGPFTAAEVKSHLQKSGLAEDESGAVRLLKDLLEAHLIAPVADNGSLEVVAKAITETRKKPLNAAFKWRRKPRAASEVAEVLRQAILRLYDRHLTDNGKAIEYKALASDPDFQLFATAAAELQVVDLAPLSREERIAFFLNVYNVLIVHAQAALGGPDNLLSRLTWFSSIKYVIGGLEYSADDVEHGILRGNRPSAASISVLLGHPEWSSGFFKKRDPRLKLAVNDVDKRIHFALNCGAQSCPPIRVYDPENLEEGLRSAASAFCEGEVEVDSSQKTVLLSKIFKWYKMDFGSKEELLRWLPEYLSKDAASALRGLLERERPGDIKLKYKDYDWGLNDG